MVRSFIVLISSLAILLFIIGCPPEKIPAKQPHQQPVAPIIGPPQPAPEPNKIEIPKAAPDKPAEIVTATEPNVTFHGKCADILADFVNDNGMVNYDMLKRRSSKLRILLAKFAVLDKAEYDSWPKEDKIAIWINAYNIQMLNIIVQNYPIQSTRWSRIILGPYSIRNIKGIWSDYKIVVMNEQFTLTEIEDRFFRGEFDEPKVFFALSMASLSSPPLRNEPYTGPKLYKQLDDQVKKFLANPKAFKIDREKQRVYLSSIFNPTYHGKDFISKYGTDKKFKDYPPAVRAVLNFLINHISPQDKTALETKNYSVEYIKYNWRINDSSRR